MKRKRHRDNPLMRIAYWAKRHTEDFWFHTRMAYQRITSPDHLCSHDVWECGSTILKYATPRVQKFVAYKNRHGIKILDPVLANKTDHTPEEWKKAEDDWEELLQKILFGLEFEYQENFYDRRAKRIQRRLKKQYGDWEAHTEKNRSFMQFDVMIPAGKGLLRMPDENELTPEQIKELTDIHGPDWKEKCSHYYDSDLHTQLWRKAEEGMKLFGEWMMGLWD